MRPSSALTEISFVGTAFCLTALAMAGSAFRAFRPEVAGLLVHPYLLPMAFLMPVVLNRFGKLPTKALVSGALFAGVYIVSSFQAPGLAPAAKIVISALTILAAAVSIGSRTEFRLGVLAFNVAAALISVRGLLFRSVVGSEVEAVDLATPNTISLYVLPPLLLGGYVLMDKTTSRSVRLSLLFCMLWIITALLTSTNRSGALGVIVVGLLLLAHGRSIRTSLILGVLGGAGYFMIDAYQGFPMIQRSINATLNPDRTSSDDLRFYLLWNSLAIGAKSPVLGVAPQQLKYELGKTPLVAERFGFIESHNVFAQIAGGSGLIALGAMIYLGWTLFRGPRFDRRKYFLSEEAKSARRLMRMMLLLWAYRGFFAHDIVFSPGFSLGLGIAIALTLVEGVWRPQPRAPASAMRYAPQLAAP